MNERMIELYKEACEFAYKVCKDEGRAGGPNDHIWNTLSTGRFAELIVRECIDIVGKVPNGYRDYRNQIEDAMRTDCLQAIQKHFGVEE